MFAPDHRRAGQELLRVCKPGGSVGFTTWLTRGLSGQLFRVIGAHAPPPPEGIGVPPQWGDRERVEALDADLRTTYAGVNEATDGTLRASAAYLVTVAKPA
jgi:hypothetical protein